MSREKHDIQVQGMAQKLTNNDLNKKAAMEKAHFSHTLSSHMETEYFDTFLSTLPVMAHSINREGVLVSVNDVWLNKMGYERDEVIGHRSIEFLTPASKEYAETKALPEFFTKGGAENIEYQFLTKDGTILHVLFSAHAWRNQDGSFKGSLAVMCDVTRQKQLEDALTKSEELYKSAQRMGKVGHWGVDFQTGGFWGSDEARRIYGFDPRKTDVTIDEVEQCIPDKERVHQALVDLIGNGEPYNLEFEIHPLSGPKKKYIKSIAEVVVNEAGIQEKVDGVVLDITEQKLADENLRKSEERYRQLFNSIRDTILVTDTERNIIDCNHIFTKVFGYTKKEIVGKKTDFLYDREDEYLEMGRELKEHIDEIHFTFVINYRNKSGEIFPGETSVISLKNDKGEIVGFIGITRDITYRKMVEVSLQKANDELQSKADDLENMNTALEVLLQKRDKDNLDLQENILSNYVLMITPFLRKLQICSAKKDQQNLLDIIETNLDEIIAPFARKLSAPMMGLTASEIQIATMIKQGYCNKEIAAILGSSKRTVDTHRQNIRRKLELQNEKINLKTYLMNL